jgi:hypothetical protein
MALLTVTQLLAIVDKFDWDSYNEQLKTDLDGSFREIVAIQGKRGAVRAGLTQFENDDPFVQKHLTGYMADRIVQLDKTTRLDVKGILQEVIGRDSGSSVDIIADAVAERVREKFAGYADWRADRIARTETGIAYNTGNVLGYRQADVTHVQVIDGDQDEECAKANGQIWTLAQALANPLAHPNCERDFAPVVE